MTYGEDFDIVSIEKDSASKAVLNHISSCCKGEKSLMVSVFDLTKNKFLYFNESFIQILGSKKSDNSREGWDFWYQLIKKDEAEEIKMKINNIIQTPFSTNLPESQFFTYHVKNIFNNWTLIHHEMSFFYFKHKLLLLNFLFDITQKERIELFFREKGSGFNQVLTKNTLISNREKEVLLLISQGLSSKEIAETLFISNHTAISHRKHLIKKFNVKNTAQLIREASKSILF